MEPYLIAMWIAVAAVILGGVIGLTGVWIPDFWTGSIGGKLLATDIIVAGTSLAACVILRWLK